MSSSHSHSHDHHDCTGNSTEHSHEHHVHQSTSDTRVRDMGLWNDNNHNNFNKNDMDAQRLDKSHGLLDHAHENDGVVLRKLQRASLLCLTFLLVEVTGGLLSGSLAILSDASHLCADLASFAVAIGASYLASLPKTANHTFGLKRVESLAALLSMLSLAFISVALGVEAIRRIYKIVIHDDDDIQVAGFLMSGIAFIGVLVNVALAFVLGEHHVHLPSDTGGCGSHDHGHSHGHEGHGDRSKSTTGNSNNQTATSCSSGHDHGHSHNHETTNNDQTAHEGTALLAASGSNDVTTTNNSSHEHVHEHVDAERSHDHAVGAPIPFLPKNINLQAAYLHVLGDLAQSVAVLIAGLIIWAFPSWTIVDPLCTLLFCTIVGYSTVGVLRTSVAVLLQEVPPSVDWKSVYDAIENIEGVSDVHDLHIWSISHGIPTLSVHCKAEQPEQALEQIYTRCRDFGIVHATIQVQAQSGECVTCTDRICRLCQFAEEKSAANDGSAMA